MEIEQLVEKFECPGCVYGGDTTCGVYQLTEEFGGRMCKSHVLGTIVMGRGNIALGLPKGFCRSGVDWFADPPKGHNKMVIRIFKEGEQTAGNYDKFNIPVWAMVEEGYLFVRTYCPRINQAYLDIIENGTLALVPGAIDVGEFIDEID